MRGFIIGNKEITCRGKIYFRMSRCVEICPVKERNFKAGHTFDFVSEGARANEKKEKNRNCNSFQVCNLRREQSRRPSYCPSPVIGRSSFSSGTGAAASAACESVISDHEDQSSLSGFCAQVQDSAEIRKIKKVIRHRRPFTVRRVTFCNVSRCKASFAVGCAVADGNKSLRSTSNHRMLRACESEIVSCLAWLRPKRSTWNSWRCWFHAFCVHSKWLPALSDHRAHMKMSIRYFSMRKPYCFCIKFFWRVWPRG